MVSIELNLGCLAIALFRSYEFKISWDIISIVNNINPTIGANPFVPILFVFPDSIEAVKKKLCPFFRIGPKCAFLQFGVVNITTGEYAQNAQFKQRNWDVLGGEVTIANVGMRWLLFVILVA
jgi:hypothetical protein